MFHVKHCPQTVLFWRPPGTGQRRATSPRGGGKATANPASDSQASGLPEYAIPMVEERRRDARMAGRAKYSLPTGNELDDGDGSARTWRGGEEISVTRRTVIAPRTIRRRYDTGTMNLRQG